MTDKQDDKLTPEKTKQEQVIDKFGVKRNVCVCGAIAYWWDGEKSLCYECLERQTDFKRGYAYNSIDRVITLEEKYGNKG